MSRFDRYMVVVEISSNGKIARLTDAEFRCLVTGVWPIAAKSSIRGRLLVGQMEAEARDIAYQARCSEAVASRTLDKLRELGMIEHDDEYGCDRCHDWDLINPAPKQTDRTATRRKQLQRNAVLRDQIRDRDGDTCQYCGVDVNWTDRKSPAGGTYDHIDPDGENSLENLVVCCRGCNASKRSRTPEEAGVVLISDPRVRSRPDPDLTKGSRREGKGREDPPPLEGERDGPVSVHPPVMPGGSRQRDLDRYDKQLDEWVAEHFPGCSPKGVQTVVSYVRGNGPRGFHPTADDLREFVAGKPAWEPFLLPEAVAA